MHDDGDGAPSPYPRPVSRRARPLLSMPGPGEDVPATLVPTNETGRPKEASKTIKQEDKKETRRRPQAGSSAKAGLTSTVSCPRGCFFISFLTYSLSLSHPSAPDSPSSLSGTEKRRSRKKKGDLQWREKTQKMKETRKPLPSSPSRKRPYDVMSCADPCKCADSQGLVTRGKRSGREHGEEM